MPGDTLFVFILVAVAAALFASNKIRLDVVAMLVVLALMLSEVLTVRESLAGFGDPVVLLVAGLLVVGEMLDRTGVVQVIGNWIIRTGGSSETRLLVLIMVAAATLSSVMSSTAVVAIFIPVVFKVAIRSGLSVSRMLMPMSFAAMISGMLTLIATTPNLVVSYELADAGFQPLGFFTFFPVGIVVLLMGIGYVLLVGRRMLGETDSKAGRETARPLSELQKDFDLDGGVQGLRIRSDSSLAGQTIAEAKVETRYGIRILAIESNGRTANTVIAGSQDKLKPGNQIFVMAPSSSIDQFMQQECLEFVPDDSRKRQRLLHEYGVAVALIHPDCHFVGKSLREADLRSHYGIHVLGIRRDQKQLDQFADKALQVADTLLVAGSWNQISRLGEEAHDFVLIETPREFEEARPAHKKAPIAIVILLAMVLLSVFSVVPVVTAVLMAAMAAIFTRCLTMEDAYRSISWSSIVLLAGMLPVAVALEKTGGTEMIVNNLISGPGTSGPYVLMTLLFFLTAGLSLFLSNTASAVLIAPVAIQAAMALELSPYPFAVTVLIAASAAFASPVASPVVTLVVEPGHYRFIDFIKVGGPLMLLTYIVNLLVTPLLFPF